MGLRRAIVVACVALASACSSFGASTSSTPPAPDDAGGADAGADAGATSEAGGDGASAPFCDGQAGAKICDSFETGWSPTWTEPVMAQGTLATVPINDATDGRVVLVASSSSDASSTTPANAYLRMQIGDPQAVHLEADVRLAKRPPNAGVEIAAVYDETTPERVTVALQVSHDGILWLVPSNGTAVQGPTFPDGWHRITIDVAAPGTSPAVRVTLDGVDAATLPAVTGFDSGTFNATIGICYANDPGWVVHVDKVVIR